MLRRWRIVALLTMAVAGSLMTSLILVMLVSQTHPETILLIESSSFEKQSNTRNGTRFHHGDGHNAKQATRSSTVVSTSSVCDGYDGVLHIRSGDHGAAAGTVFFIYVINQLIYAERYNLLPWVHLNNISRHVYDPIVHQSNINHQFRMLGGKTVSFTSDGYRRFGFGSYAGPPTFLLDDSLVNNSTPISMSRDFHVSGTGVWNHYFEPVSGFDPLSGIDVGCQQKHLLTMHYYHLNPSMLWYCPWSVKSWPYSGIPPRLAPAEEGRSVKEWFEPMRQKGHQVTQRYIRFRPAIVNLAREVVPDGTQCLSMHIRHSDKGGTARKAIPLEDFLPYAEAYLNGGGEKIFLATDSTQVLEQIEREWPTSVTANILRQSDNVLRSTNRTAVFELGKQNHHSSNSEVLVDILSLSKCQFFLHGFSAVSEAAMYLNFDLHHNSVDLESHPANQRMEPDAFVELVKHQRLSS